MELFDYQKEAVSRIVKAGLFGTGPTYLADEMGLGKSAIALTVARAFDVERLLVVCPSVGKLVWKKEAARWWPGMPVYAIEDPVSVQLLKKERGIFIISYSLISLSKNGGYDYAAGILKLGKPVDMTVLDEAHALKNPGANRTRAILGKMLPCLGFCLPMSGTPAPNHPGELFPILRAIFPFVITKNDGTLMRQYEFETAYCKVATKYFGSRQVRVIEGGKNLDTLREKLSPFMIRRRKKDVLKELPDMTFDTYPILAPNAPVFNAKGLSDDDLINRLQQSDEHVMRMRRQLGEAKVQGACEAICDALDSSSRKVLAFAHHQSVIDGLMVGLAGYSPVKIDGRDIGSVRDKAITRFLNDPACRVFIGNIQAAGTSITLVGPNNDVSDVFLVEADFNPGNNVQAASRIHRIGQKNAVQVWFLTAADTYDDRVQDILARKTSDFNQLFN